jgi:hypothetical protein
VTCGWGMDRAQEDVRGTSIRESGHPRRGGAGGKPGAGALKDLEPSSVASVSSLDLSSFPLFLSSVIPGPCHSHLPGGPSIGRKP